MKNNIFIKRTLSEKKQSLIQDYQTQPYEVGMSVFVLNSFIKNNNDDKLELCKILSINKEENTAYLCKVKDEYYLNKVSNYSNNSYAFLVHLEDISSKSSSQIGADPFLKEDILVQKNYSLDSILSNLGLLEKRPEYDIGGTIIQDLNWNPYVLNKNNDVEYYQRDFCWSLKDKQFLINSIYNKVDCGLIIIRNRDWHENEELHKLGIKNLFWRDVVDGKQRLNAVVEFIHNKFKDSFGNYFADLSSSAQRKFIDHQLFNYAEIKENTPDHKVIEQFIRMNISGKAQSKKHLEIVKNISDII